MKNKIETIFICSFSFCIVLVLMIFSFLIHDNMHFDEKNLNKYIDNWKLNPIMDIKKGSNGQCPDNYFPLISSKYPGTNRGCNCKDSEVNDYKDDSVFLNFCTEYQLNNNCFEINEQKPIELFYWKKTFLCASRNEDISYSKVIKGSYKDTCSEGQKSCGFIDSENNLFCVDKREECPINYFQILPKGSTPEVEFEVSSIPLEDNENILYYSNKNEKGKILVEAIVTSDQNVCAYPNQGNFGENKYILNKNKGEKLCEDKLANAYFDDRYKRIDTETLGEVYYENNLDPYISELPNYPIDKERQISLSVASYLGIKNKCFNDKLKVSDDLTIFKPDFRNITPTAFSLMVFMIFDFILIVCGYCAFRIYSFENSDKQRYAIADIGHFLFLTVSFAILAGIFGEIKGAMNSYDIVKKEQCVDNLMFDNFELAYKGIEKAKKYSIVFLSLILVEAIVKIGYCIYFYGNSNWK